MDQEKKTADHRSNKRRHLLYYLPVIDSSTAKEIGRLVDITNEGLRILCEKTRAKGEILDILMDPPNKDKGEAPINLSIECTWAGASINSDFFEAGYVYKNITDIQKIDIDMLIEQFGFKD
jgi:hypothetical protein